MRLESNVYKLDKSSYSSYRIFDIVTKLSIVIMIIYIVVKISYLLLAGDTRDVLAVETKQWVIKNLKNIVCNEVICTDEYISENKIISVNSMHERNEVASLDEQIKKAITSNNVKENILTELKKVEKSLKDYKVAKNRDSSSKDEKVKETKDEQVKQNKEKKQEIVEQKLLDYKASQKELLSNVNKIVKLENERKQSYLLNQFYTVDGSTSIDRGIFDPKKLLSISNKIQKNSEVPQILIYHTHASEKYKDSSNKEADTVVGVGAYLKKILEEEYNYKVLHVKEKYDVVNNKWNRNAYDTALPKIREIIKKNPSIEVVIDLHRDSGSKPVVCNIGGIKVAKVMCFNGVCRSEVGPRSEIPNKNLLHNLAFSLDMHMTSLEMYKDFTKKIYLKGYRYNMHLAKKYMLMEVGNNKNTVEQARNAMVPLAKILNKVLTTK